MLGLAVDSQFASNPYLYLLYTYDLGQARHARQLEPDGLAAPARADQHGQPGNRRETVLLGTYTERPLPDALEHGRLRAIRRASRTRSAPCARRPDGTLWVGNGDAAELQHRRPAAPFAPTTSAGMAGKLMHIDRNGHGPARPSASARPNSNLAHVCTKLHAKGFRNPFRFALRPGGGITLGRRGLEQPRGDRPGRRPAAQSYGWPCYEGTIQTPGYRDRAECAGRVRRARRNPPPAGPRLPRTAARCR